MEATIEAEAIPTLSRPYTLEQALAIATYERTGFLPRIFPVRKATVLSVERDVLCIGGTGSGKTLAFVMPSFLSKGYVVWVVSPLNFIKQQQCDAVNNWGLNANAVNASTCDVKTLEEVKKGKYDVFISSPESYHSINKLRKALRLPNLAKRIHTTVFDEAHCIKTWSDDFRKTHSRCGDLQPLMKYPEHCPILATTATASDLTKKVIVSSLKLRSGYPYENLGNFRANLCCGVYRMTGSQKLYDEVDKLLGDKPIDEHDQTFVFVHSFKDAHGVAGAIRKKKFKLTRKKACQSVAVYLSLKRERSKKRIAKMFEKGRIKYLVNTEALTMGVDSSGVGQVINFLMPRTEETWGQRAGRCGQGIDGRGDCIIMAMPNMIKDELEICAKGDISITGSAARTSLKPEPGSDAEKAEAPC